MKSVGWEHILNIDNDGEKGGGWSHDLLNDAAFDGLMTKAHAGVFTAVMIAFPCSSSSIARLFDATNNDGGGSWSASHQRLRQPGRPAGSPH